MRLFLALAVVTFAVPAFAAEECTIEAGPNDVVKKSGDVVIEAGQVVEDAIAVDGAVIIKKGARVKSAVSLHGSVTIEGGARVEKTALAIGGRVTVAPDARVEGVVEINDRGLRVRGSDGDDVDLSLSWGGKSLGQRIADEALTKVRNCKVK
ncbi:MAG: hypothetical protein ACOZQL_16245 [Myxococcota bacterium]